MTLEVSVPWGRKVDVEAMIRERLSWIDREYARAANAKRILGEDRVMFGGQYLRIVYIEDTKEELVPSLATGEVAVRTSDRRRVRELVRRWFLKETSAYVVRKVRESSPLLGVRPSRVDVREIGKWGYCTRGGRLSFSWQLVALPERLKEYVIFHELTHLIEFNHSPAFKKRLASVCPDFRRRERELAQIVPYDRMVLE
jgi:predicted metal-dependent hydrolase